MTVRFTVNNYTLGAKVRTTPVHKIVKQERVDSRHTLIIYANVTERERQFIEKVLAKKAQVI